MKTGARGSRDLLLQKIDSFRPFAHAVVACAAFVTFTASCGAASPLQTVLMPPSDGELPFQLPPHWRIILISPDGEDSLPATVIAPRRMRQPLRSQNIPDPAQALEAAMELPGGDVGIPKTNLLWQEETDDIALNAETNRPFTNLSFPAMPSVPFVSQLVDFAPTTYNTVFNGDVTMTLVNAIQNFTTYNIISVLQQCGDGCTQNADVDANAITNGLQNISANATHAAQDLLEIATPDPFSNASSSATQGANATSDATISQEGVNPLLQNAQALVNGIVSTASHAQTTSGQ
jgi:hypothetical protein